MAWSSLRKQFGLVLALSLLLLGLLAPAPLAAQTSGVTLQVEPYLSGHFKYGEWLPLRVTLTNSGTAISGQIRVDSTQGDAAGAWIVPVDLPTGAQKQVTLYVLPPNYALGMRVRLMNGTYEVARQTAPLTLHPNTDYLIGVIAARAEPFAVLNGISLNTGIPRAVRMISLGLDDIPDRTAGLGTLDALVISDTDTSGLDAEQRRTLVNWVENGGRLIIGGGASAARALAGLPTPLTAPLGVIANPVELDSLTGLETFGAQPIRVPGPFVASPAPANGALITQGQQTLVNEYPLGEGTLTYSALDLSASPFDAWAGAAPFWTKLLTPGSDYPLNMPSDVSPNLVLVNAMTQTLQYLPALALPSLNVLGTLLVLYIVLVGPLNYLVLRRLKKLDWGWLTIPVLTLLFALGAFGVSNQLRGGDVVLNTLSVANFYADGTAGALKTYVGIFSPNRDNFTLSIPGQALVIPISAIGDPFGRGGINTNASTGEIVQGDPTLVKNLQINQGALQALAIESEPPANWGIESNLHFDDTHVRGTLVNHLDVPVTDIALVSGDRFTAVADLAPGETRTVESTWQSFGGSLSSIIKGNGVESEKRRQALNNYFSIWNGSKGQIVPRPLLLGWLNVSPLNVEIENRTTAHQASTLVMADLKLDYTPGTVTVRANDWRIAQVASTSNIQMCGQINFVGISNGTLTLRFRPRIPVSIERVTKLVVDIEQSNPHEVELETLDGKWVAVDTGSGAGQVAVPEPANFVAPDGTVHLRLTNERGGQQCALYNIELEGEVAP